MGRKHVDRVGHSYGSLTVICRDGATGDRKGIATWRCRCACGAETVVRGDHLSSGNTTTCGVCISKWHRMRRERHGQTNTPEYKIWVGIWARCTNPNTEGFANYGGRGISVCAEWESFSAFRHDMGARPSPVHSVDRIDNDKGYEPGNCRWATPSQQRLNQRKRRHEHATSGFEAP